MRWWQSVPTGFGSLVLAIPALSLIGNLLWHGLNPASAPFKFGAALDGVSEVVRPVMSVTGLLNGRTQGQVGLAVGPLVPMQRLAVRLRNQVLYDVFSAASTPAMIVSRGHTLVETAYVQEYCQRNEAAFRAAAVAWLPRLRAMQDRVEQRGQTFLYVLTPSKVSYDPALVPPGYPCRATASARTGLVAIWRGMLDGAGIQYVDTTALVAAAKSAYPFPLFPRGGTHWNMVGASLAAQAIGAKLDALRHDDAFVPFTFTWTLTHSPVYPDDDLATLMNLLWPDRDYPVPLVTFHNAVPESCRPVSVALVGGSFMHQFAQILSGGACHPHFEQWEYWQVIHLIWPYPGAMYEVAPLEAAWREADVLGADVVVYEENEQNMARSNHGPALLEFLERSSTARP